MDPIRRLLLLGRTSALVLVFCAASMSQALAQVDADAAPAFVMPERPLFVIECDGPALAWSRFLPTDLGRALAADDAALLEHIVAEPVAALRTMLGDVLDDRAQLDELQRVLLDYGGRVTIVGVTGADDTRQLSLVARLTDDGSGTTERLARLATKLGERLPIAARAYDRELVLSYGPDASRLLEGVRARPDETREPATDRGIGGAAFGVWVDGAQLIEMAQHGGGWLEPEKSRALGFDGLRDVRVLVRPTAARVEFEVSVGLVAERHGVLAGLFPLVGTRPATLTHLLPADTQNWGLTQKRWHVAVGALLDAFDARAMVREGMSIHLDSDLLVHVADEMLWFGDDMERIGVAMRLADPVAWDAAWQKLSKAQSLDDEAPSLYRDIAVSDISIGELCHARIDDLFVVAMGTDEVRHAILQQIIDRQLASRAAEATEAGESVDDMAPGHEHFERLTSHRPAGLCGRGRLQFGVFVALLRDEVFEALPRELGQPWIEALDRANARLTASDLDLAHFHLMSGSTDDRWVLRAFW